MNLAQWLTQNSAPANLSDLLGHVVKACTQIHSLVRQGDLAGFQGASGVENVQGEQQQKLDLIANQFLADALHQCQACFGFASEEMDFSEAANQSGDFLVVFDPLDGSSNIDINMPVGTIFSVLPSTGEPGDDAFLQPGVNQVAAGYVLYGTSTVLAITLGSSTQFFTLNPETLEFVATKQSPQQVPKDTKEFAINASNQRFWQAPVQEYVSECLLGATGPREKNFNMRWVAAMVGDVHRILCRGGLFAYPLDTKDPTKTGKLRLLYEANPMSMLIEAAGGKSTTGTQSIMSIQPTSLHQRVPVILGSTNEVTYLENKHSL